MTGISPLQFIHKKGLFGDHHEKKESDLLEISEVKNLTIVQIVKYKKSKIQLNNLDINGLNLPLKEELLRCYLNQHAVLKIVHLVLIVHQPHDNAWHEV